MKFSLVKWHQMLLKRPMVQVRVFDWKISQFLIGLSFKILNTLPEHKKPGAGVIVLAVVQKWHWTECSGATPIVDQCSLILAKGPFSIHCLAVAHNLENETFRHKGHLLLIPKHP